MEAPVGCLSHSARLERVEQFHSDEDLKRWYFGHLRATTFFHLMLLIISLLPSKESAAVLVGCSLGAVGRTLVTHQMTRQMLVRIVTGSDCNLSDAGSDYSEMPKVEHLVIVTDD